MAKIGLYKAHFAAIALKRCIDRTNFHRQLRLAFVLERRQQREHLGVFRNFWRIEHALAVTVVVNNLFLQVDRDQLIVHQLHLTVAELKVGTANVFTPLVSLHDPDPVLAVRCAGRARHVVHLLFIL